MLFGVPLVHALLLAPGLVQASSGAYWVQPSQKWVGIDGTWSSFEVNLGGPAQPVQLLVNTAISEVWAVGTGGCPASNNACASERGNTYSAADSQNYSPLGSWELGLTSTGVRASGDYGLDRLAMFNSLEGETVTINNALIASVNTTDYFQGYIGLGVIRGRFGDRVTTPLISQMVEEYGLIASNSYGYTAGAWHIDAGVPASLILGGYDPLRFQSHNTAFNLNPDIRMPQARLRGISANTKDPSKPPPGWAGQTHKSLVTMNDSLVVTIDTSVPYMALPESICDRFAAALNLTYNSTLDVYMFSGDQLTSPDSALRADRVNFTFSLSSWDNNDGLGKPLEAPGVINITISGQAFTQYLSYPYKNMFGPYDNGTAYFPLRRAMNVNEIVIGRAFMQEAYIVTKYEERVFSIYQARFPANAASNYTVEAIGRPANSDYPAFVPKPQKPGLNAGQTAGVVVGVVGVSVTICFALWLWRRRRNKAALAEAPLSPSEKKGDELCQDGGSTLGPDEPAGRLTSLVSFLTRGRRPRRAGPAPLSHELDGSRTQPVEVGADATHERYEMPAPVEPVELDATHDHSASDDTTEFGTEGSEQAMSEYEIARRKLQRQLQGPLPTYSPPNVPIVHVGHPSIDRINDTKSIQDVSPVAHYRPGDDENPSPTVSAPSEGNNTNSFSSQIPSPMSPNPEWGTRFLDLPSPTTVTSGQFPLRRTGSASSPRERQLHGGLGRSASTNSSGHPAPHASPRSPDLLIPPTPIQRTPIDQSEIVCLGPLPDNVCLPNQKPALPRNHPTILPGDSASQAGGSDATKAVSTSSHPLPMPAYPQNYAPPAAATPAQPPPPPPAAHPRHGLRIETPTTSFGQVRRASRRESAESLGSDFTVDEEERMVDKDTTQQQNGRAANADGVSPQSASSPERIDAATELVHIPQVSERRYSWEDDKR